jgi:hypothetical protein
MAQDTKGVIRCRKSKKDWQYNDHSPFLIYGFSLYLWYLVVIVLSVLFWFTASEYTFGILCHCIVSPFFDLRHLITPLVSCAIALSVLFLIYGFLLYLWYLVVIVLSVLFIRCRKSKKDWQCNDHKIPKV